MDSAYMTVEIVNKHKPKPNIINSETLSPLSDALLSSFDPLLSRAHNISVLQTARNQTINIITKRRDYRDRRTYTGYVTRRFFSYCADKKFLYNSRLYGLVELISGISAVFEPVSAETSQDLVHAIESFSLILSLAPIEDKYCLTQQCLPTLLYSLLALEAELTGFTAVLREVITVNRSRFMNHYIAQKLITGSYVPVSVQALTVSIDEGLNRLCRAYFDVIPSYPLPQPYEQALKRRLRAIKINTR
jgi:hypothetical protein